MLRACFVACLRFASLACSAVPASQRRAVRQRRIQSRNVSNSQSSPAICLAPSILRADYQIGAEFLTERIRWGVVRSDSWLRGYQSILCQRHRRADFSAESRIITSDSTSACVTTLFSQAAVGSLYFGRCRRGLDRQPPGSSRRTGTGFYIQHFIGGRHFLHGERSLETQRRRALPASLQWRANRSESEPESLWARRWA